MSWGKLLCHLKKKTKKTCSIKTRNFTVYLEMFGTQHISINVSGRLKSFLHRHWHVSFLNLMSSQAVIDAIKFCYVYMYDGHLILDSLVSIRKEIVKSGINILKIFKIVKYFQMYWPLICFSNFIGFIFCFQLLTIFVSGKLSQYQQFYKDNKEFIQSLGK